MTTSIKDIIGILSDNLKLRKSVMPLTKSRATGWTKGLDLPFGGETILYTGQMYQMIPSVTSLDKMMKRLEGSWLLKLMFLGRWMNKLFAVTRFMVFPSKKEQQIYDNYLRNIVILLKRANIKIGYLYKKELYSGALVYDHGLKDKFKKHAHKVAKLLKKHGVKQLITVDPHTTDVFKHIYPKLVDGFDISVKSYLEVLAEKASAKKSERPLTDITIHDSCVYARYVDVIAQPRTLLANAGYNLVEAEDSGPRTHCCGGPIESLFPVKTHQIATKRLEQLKSTGTTAITTMCPICLLNLKNAVNGSSNVQLSDISQYLVDGVI